MEDPNAVHYFKCATCNDGFVCKSCISNFDPIGSIFLEKFQLS
jgi:hypothetical protein